MMCKHRGSLEKMAKKQKTLRNRSFDDQQK